MVTGYNRYTVTITADHAYQYGEGPISGFAESVTFIIGNIKVTCNEWLGSQVVSVLDSGAEGPGFKSQLRHCRVTVLGNWSHPSCLCSPSSKTGSSPLKGCEGNCRPGGK